MSSLPTVTPTPPLIRPVTNSISLTTSDINSYRENGYHIVPNLLSPSQLEQWRTIIFSAVKDRADKKYKFAKPLEEDHTNVDFDYYDSVFTQRVNLWQTHNSVKELLLERVEELLEKLLLNYQVLIVLEFGMIKH
jgi:phytanoyl-CoA hydroxylase